MTSSQRKSVKATNRRVPEILVEQEVSQRVHLSADIYNKSNVTKITTADNSEGNHFTNDGHS